MEIRFDKLKWLAISQNEIFSIENLSYIWMPNLEGLYITKKQDHQDTDDEENILPQTNENGNLYKRSNIIVSNYITDPEYLNQLDVAPSWKFLQV